MICSAVLICMKYLRLDVKHHSINDMQRFLDMQTFIHSFVADGLLVSEIYLVFLCYVPLLIYLSLKLSRVWENAKLSSLTSSWKGLHDVMRTMRITKGHPKTTILKGPRWRHNNQKKSAIRGDNQVLPKSDIFLFNKLRNIGE